MKMRFSQDMIQALYRKPSIFKYNFGISEYLVNIQHHPNVIVIAIQYKLVIANYVHDTRIKRLKCVCTELKNNQIAENF